MNEFVKYVKIKRLGSDENKGIFDSGKVVVEEKLDGANFRVFIKDGKVLYGSRNVQLSSDDGKVHNIPDNFKRAFDYIQHKLKDVDLHKYDGYMLIGEVMIPHTLKYDWEKCEPIYFYDVYNGKYLSYDEKMKVFKDLRLPVVRLIGIYDAEYFKDKGVDDSFVPKSMCGDIYAEGVVLKNYDLQIFAKYVRDRFKEENRKVFGGSAKYGTDDNEKIILKYCTNARIEKKIYELLDFGEELDMKLMSKLPRMVWNDIIEEEGKNILNGNYVLDLRKIRKMISARCVAVLRNMIERRGL